MKRQRHIEDVINITTRAIENNVAWCEVIARLHGVPTHREADAWIALAPMPPFYPNLITLTTNACIDTEIAELAGRLGESWGIKDSFCALSLVDSRFEIALRGEWYALAPSLAVTAGSVSREISTVRTQGELQRWTSAWGDSGSSIFISEILNRDDVWLLYACQDGELVSGLAVNSGGEALGISNAFGEPGGIQDCIRYAATLKEGWDLVGYGSISEVRSLKRLGFRSLSPMRVWIRH